MVEYELDALYEYYCVPKLDADAFLIAKILHWDEHNFLEGEANLFFEGKYIGKSILDTRNTSDTLCAVPRTRWKCVGDKGKDKGLHLAPCGWI